MSESIILTPFWSGLLIGACGVLGCCALVIWRLLGLQKRKLAAIHLEMEQLLADKQDLKSNLGLGEQQIANLENQGTRLDQELHDRAQRIEGLQNEVSHLKSIHVELSTRLEQERIRAGERLEAIQNAEQQMIHHFESLGAKILEEKSQRFSEQNQTNLDRLLTPLREQIGEFRKKVDDVYVTDSKDRAALREAIRNLNLENQGIGQEANNLVRALKGDKKVQGKGNLLRQAGSFVDLGVKVKKTIPKSIMDQASDEDFEMNDDDEKSEGICRKHREVGQ
ncbi:MAG: DNA recombination protein RmuC [Methylococcales bacterium]